MIYGKVVGKYGRANTCTAIYSKFEYFSQKNAI
jgi:hypothetical protein